ncbi:MAG: hypothetical protein IT379_27905, partial [Deltaproteobacteria bacterium]|nr:hypothetical protein [Deltaproteobacteria bacterium]
MSPGDDPPPQSKQPPPENPPTHGVVVKLRGPRASEDERIRGLQRARRVPVAPDVDLDKLVEEREQRDGELLDLLLRRAERAFAEKRYKTALRDCERARAITVASPALYDLLTRVHLALGDRFSATEAAERSVTLEPHSGARWAALARLRADAGDEDAAVEAAVRGTMLDPDSGDPWAALAEIGRDLAGPLHDYGRAWYLEQALAREPERALWLAQHARHSVGLSERDQVVKEAERALALDPRNLRVRCAHAFVCARLGDDPERALALYQELEPMRGRLDFAERVEMADAMAELYDRTGAPAKAYPLLEEVAQEADTAHRWLVAADAAITAGRWKEGLFDAARALELEPKDPTVMRLVGERWAAVGAHRAAESVLTRYLALHPDDADVYATRASVRERQERWIAARRDLDRAVASSRDRDEKLGNLRERALFRIGRGDVEGALEDLGQCVRLDDSGLAHVERGRYLLQRYRETGDPKTLARAMRDFDGAIKRGLEDGYGYRALAREAGQGHYEASCADLERAAVHGIGMDDWHQELSELHARHGHEAEAAAAAERAETAQRVVDLADGVRRRMRRHQLDDAFE